MAAPIETGQAIAPDRGATLTAGRLALLASLAALGALATNIMLPAFPAMALDLGVAPRELAWTLSSFFVVFAVGQLFVGPLSDTFGRAPFVLGGLAVFVAGSIVCTLSPSLPVLIAGRATQALGACAASVLARAIARDLYHGPELTRALALVMIAMAAAPGFSPALGTGMTPAFGWRSTFVLVAVAGVLVALHYRLSAGETLPFDRRRPAHPLAIARTYRDLALDPRFIAPALSVSLIIGCLYSFFGAAPAILMTGMGLSCTGLSIFFAATVVVVFGSGLATGRLVARWGAPRVGMAGLLIAAAGGLWLLLQGGATAPAPFMAAVTLFLAGMGLVNPVGTAIALEPFGDRAGIASALLGFLQMSCAAVGTALVGALPVDASRLGGFESEPQWYSPDGRLPEGISTALFPGHHTVFDVKAVSDRVIPGVAGMRTISAKLVEAANRARKGSGKNLSFFFFERRDYRNLKLHRSIYAPTKHEVGDAALAIPLLSTGTRHDDDQRSISTRGWPGLLPHRSPRRGRRAPASLRLRLRRDEEIPLCMRGSDRRLYWRDRGQRRHRHPFPVSYPL